MLGSSGGAAPITGVTVGVHTFRCLGVQWAPLGAPPQGIEQAGLEHTYWVLGEQHVHMFISLLTLVGVPVQLFMYLRGLSGDTCLDVLVSLFGTGV